MPGYKKGRFDFLGCLVFSLLRSFMNQHTMRGSFEHFTDDQLIALKWTMEILAWLSFSLSLPVGKYFFRFFNRSNDLKVITYVVFKRRFPSSMALYFSVASLVFSISLIMGTMLGEKLFTSHSLCILQGKITLNCSDVKDSQYNFQVLF